MTRADKQAKLRRIMARHDWKSHDIAKMTYYQPQSVREWMCGKREVPERALRLLAFEIKARG
jgi:hypothetical protein